MLENKEFRLENDPFNENHINIINKCHRWQKAWIDKNQLDALIEILIQLKEVRNEQNNNL